MQHYLKLMMVYKQSTELFMFLFQFQKYLVSVFQKIEFFTFTEIWVLMNILQGDLLKIVV